MKNSLRTFIRETIDCHRGGVIVNEQDTRQSVPKGIDDIKFAAAARGFRVKGASEMTGPQWQSVQGAEAFITENLPALAASIDKDVTGYSADPGLVLTTEDLQTMIANVKKYLEIDMNAEQGFPYSTTLYIAAFLGEEESIIQRVGEGLSTAGRVMYYSTAILPIIDSMSSDLGSPQNESYGIGSRKNTARHLGHNHKDKKLVTEGLLGTLMGGTSLSARLIQYSIAAGARAATAAANVTAAAAIRNSAQFASVIAKSTEISSAYSEAVSELRRLGVGQDQATDALRAITHGAFMPAVGTTKKAAADVLSTKGNISVAASRAGISLDDATVATLQRERSDLVGELQTFVDVFDKYYAGTTRVGQAAGAVSGASASWFGLATAVAGALGLGDALVSDDTAVLLTAEQVSALAGAQAIRIRARPLVESLRRFLEGPGVAVTAPIEKRLTLALGDLSYLCEPDVTVFMSQEDFQGVIANWDDLLRSM